MPLTVSARTPDSLGTDRNSTPHTEGPPVPERPISQRCCIPVPVREHSSAVSLAREGPVGVCYWEMEAPGKAVRRRTRVHTVTLDRSPRRTRQTSTGVGATMITQRGLCQAEITPSTLHRPGACRHYRFSGGPAGSRNDPHFRDGSSETAILARFPTVRSHYYALDSQGADCRGQRGPQDSALSSVWKMPVWQPAGRGPLELIHFVHLMHLPSGGQGW
jgi:hypothetical protein